jgi:hypothetical protein
VKETGWSLIRKTRLEARSSLLIGVLSFIVGFVIVIVLGWRMIEAMPDSSGRAPPAWATTR